MFSVGQMALLSCANGVEQTGITVKLAEQYYTFKVCLPGSADNLYTYP